VSDTHELWGHFYMEIKVYQGSWVSF